MNIYKYLLTSFFVSCFILLMPLGVFAASLYLSPSAGSFNVDSTFSIAVKVNTNSVAINAAEGVLIFDPDYLEVKNIRKGGVFTLWTTEPNVAPSAGRISFGGGVPNPGYTGSGGTIITITFKAEKIGSTQINFASGAVLANDGKGTNILASKQGGTYTIQPKTEAPAPPPAEIGPPPLPQITSITHPDQNQWYNKNNAEFSWALTNDITGISFTFDQNPETIPGDISDGVFDKKSFQTIAEGIWYFHLKFKNKEGWGSASHFKIQIDLTPPLPFEIKILEGNITTAPQPILMFEAKDELSGIAYYELKIGDGDIFPLKPDITIHNPYKMPYQAPGAHPISIQAVDKAGNKQETKTILLVKPSLFYKLIRKPLDKIKSILIDYLLLIIGLIYILIVLAVLVFVLYKARQKDRRLKKEVKEVKESVEKGFAMLEDDLKKELEELERTKHLRPLTPKEKALREKLIKDLALIRKNIAEEIKDLEKEIE